jgi:hypothetical protein
MLNKELAHLEAEKVQTLQNIARISLEQSQFEAEKLKQNAIKEHANSIISTKEAYKARLDFDKIKLANETAKAQSDADKAKSDADKAKFGADKAKSDADKAKFGADKARLDADKAKSDADKARFDADKAKSDADKSKSDADKSKSDADKAKSDADKSKSDADKARLDADKAKSDADKAKSDADKAKSDADKARLDADKAKSDADKAKSDADKSKSDANKSKSDADKAKLDADKSRLDADKAKLDADKARSDADKSKSDADKARSDADKAKSDADKAKSDADKAKSDADKVSLEKQKVDIEFEQVKYIAMKAHDDAETAKYVAITLESYADKARLEAEKASLDTNKSLFDAKIAHHKTVSALLQIKQEETKKTQVDAEIAQLATTKVLALANTAKDNARIIYSQLELERIDVEKSRLDLVKAQVNNAPANAAKAQADALMLVQRSKIMKTLQILSIQSCKRVDELYFNKSVISITNIYQKTYNNNKCATGFGDFIRGCYFLLDFCEIFHFQPNIVINHPLNEFLENHSIINNSGVVELVTMFEDNNWDKHILNQDNIIINTIRKNVTMPKFVNYLCTSPIDNNNINIYNILFPYFDVSLEHTKIMRDILKPSQEIKECVFSTLKKFELTENNYICIHIRSGDNYLNCVDKQFNLTYLNHITNNIIMLLNKHPNMYFLLIADNNFIKLYLSSKQIHRLYIIFNEIGHLGENDLLGRDKVKNTMLDFYLFAHSSNIYAFSSYDHGSGFSFWCAKTYDIPYSCKIIKH